MRRPTRTGRLPGVLALCLAPLPAVPAAGETVSFDADLVPVLRRQCAACHLTGQEAGKMALHPKAAYDTLVEVPSVESEFLRVKPGAPDESYLLMKLEGSHLDHGGIGLRMPMGGAPLDAATLAQFRAWIAMGAPRN